VDNIKDYYENFLSMTYWYRSELGRWVGIILNFFMPILFGIFMGNAYKSITAAQNKLSWPLWTPHWPILVVLFFWLIGYLLARYTRHLSNKDEELYNALKWFCEDIGTRKDTVLDIRCTIWIPLGKQSRKEPIRLLQAVDYFPKTSTMNNGMNRIRRNGKRYRTFKVSKADKDGTIKPVGIIGRTALQSVSGDEPTVERERMLPQVQFVEHMVNNWNFSTFQAQRLTSDRRSYLCLPMTNREKSELLGILYFDSCNPDVFSDEFVTKIEKYLPRFASIITTL
jgi:hypothetical protein